MWLNTSVFMMLVPNQGAPEGGPVLGKRFPWLSRYWSKRYGEIHGAKTAKTRNSRTMAIPMYSTHLGSPRASATGAKARRSPRSGPRRTGASGAGGGAVV